MGQHDAAERVARTAYGRLVAYLAVRTRDIAAAEEALAAAFLRALETWPVKGVPERPEAWLLTAARNQLKDGWRREAVRSEAVVTLELLMEEAAGGGAVVFPDAPFPDERLKLMFVCTHPAIEAGVRTPLMLQTVLGLSAERIASSFMVRPAAMGQRLSRAKAKIRDAGIGFEVPEAGEWGVRLPHLLDAIYAAYGLGWGDFVGEDGPPGLAGDAVELGLALHGLVPVTAEVNGLLALMLYCEARRAARFAGGDYVALPEQATELWDEGLMGRANGLLNAVVGLKQFGRYQLEAAIQSVHMRRWQTGVTDWGEITQLYQGLLRVAPSLAGQVGYAAALTEAERAAEGLAVLDVMEAGRMADYQPYWATRAHVLRALGQGDAAREAYGRAIGLSQHGSQRAFLMRRMAEV